MTPSEILVRAADLIRDTAAKASPGRWQTIRRLDRAGNHVQSTFIRPSAEPNGCVRERGVRPHESADYEWIALMSPAVAPKIESVLRDAGHCYRVYERGAGPVGVTEVAALALAKAVLGIPEETT